MQSIYVIFQMGGPFMWILLGLSIFSIAIIIVLIIKFIILSFEKRKFIKNFFMPFSNINLNQGINYNVSYDINYNIDNYNIDNIHYNGNDKHNSDNKYKYNGNDNRIDKIKNKNNDKDKDKDTNINDDNSTNKNDDKNIKKKVDKYFENLYAIKSSDDPFTKIFKHAYKKSFQKNFNVERFLTFNIESYLQKVIKGLDLISAIGNIAPLIGFLGTVFGMIVAFQSIANANTINAKIVAEGIYQALITTCYGLIIAIPCFITDSILNHIMQNIINEFEEIGEDFLENIKDRESK